MNTATKISIKSAQAVALLTLLLVETKAAEPLAGQPGVSSGAPDPVEISNRHYTGTLKAREDWLRISNTLVSRAIKPPEWPLVDRRPSVASNSSLAETNAIYGQATNGCRLGLRLEKPAVRAGQPVTIFVTIQNLSKSGLYYPWTSHELPWFCHFNVVDKAGNQVRQLPSEAPYVWSGRGETLSPGEEDRYEIRLDRLFVLPAGGKYFICAQKIVAKAEVSAGPAVLQVER
jgi:hypothetical protein